MHCRRHQNLSPASSSSDFESPKLAHLSCDDRFAEWSSTDFKSPCRLDLPVQAPQTNIIIAAALTLYPTSFLWNTSINICAAARWETSLGCDMTTSKDAPQAHYCLLCGYCSCDQTRDAGLWSPALITAMQHWSNSRSTLRMYLLHGERSEAWWPRLFWHEVHYKSKSCYYMCRLTGSIHTMGCRITVKSDSVTWHYCLCVVLMILPCSQQIVQNGGKYRLGGMVLNSISTSVLMMILLDRRTYPVAEHKLRHLRSSGQHGLYCHSTNQGKRSSPKTRESRHSGQAAQWAFDGVDMFSNQEHRQWSMYHDMSQKNYFQPITSQCDILQSSRRSVTAPQRLLILIPNYFHDEQFVFRTVPTPLARSKCPLCNGTTWFSCFVIRVRLRFHW